MIENFSVVYCTVYIGTPLFFAKAKRGVLAPPPPLVVALILTCAILRFIGAVRAVTAAVAILDRRHAADAVGSG